MRSPADDKVGLSVARSFRWLIAILILFATSNLHSAAKTIIGSPPLVVTNVVVEATFPTSARIHWSPATDPDGDPVIYKVRLYVMNPDNTKEVYLESETASTQIVLSSLTPGTLYHLEISSTDGVYWSEPGEAGTTFSTPLLEKPLFPTPSGIRALAPTNKVVAITWSYPVIIGPSVYFLPEYRIRGTNQNPTWVSLPRTRTPTALLSNLPPNTRIDFRVIASNGREVSPIATVENLTSYSERNTAPAVPFFVTGTLKMPRQLLLGWSRSYDMEGDAVVYEAEFRQALPIPTNQWIAAGQTSSTNLLITNLLPSTTYLARVRAGDSKAWSEWRSASIQTISEDAIYFEVLNPLKLVHLTSTNALVSWNAVGAPRDVTPIYVLEVFRGGGVKQYDWFTTETTALLPNLFSGTPYTLRLRAYYEDQVASAELLSRFFATPYASHVIKVPTTPANVQVTEVGTHSARVEWFPSFDPNLDPLTYEVQLYSRDLIIKYTTTSTNITLNGLSPDTRYFVHLRAHDGSSYSEPAPNDPSFLTLLLEQPVPPAAPGVPRAGHFRTGGVTITWMGSKDDNGDLPFYEVQWRQKFRDGVGEWSPALRTDITYLDIYGLPPGGSFEVRVRASDGELVSNWIMSDTPILTPGSIWYLFDYLPNTNLQAIQTTEGLVLTWQSVEPETVLQFWDGPTGVWMNSEAAVERSSTLNRALVPHTQPFSFYRVVITKPE